MAPSKPSILLVTPSPLLPADSGGRIYTWGLTEPLADRYDYHLIAMANADERAELDADRAALLDRYHQVFRTVHFVDRPLLPADLDRRRVLRHLLFHARHALPLMDVSYYSAEAVDLARSLIAEHDIGLLEVDHMQMAFVRRFVPDVPAVLVNHNIEGDLNPFWPTRRWSPPEMAVWLAFGKLSRRNGRRIELGNRLGFAAKFFISPTDAARVDDACPKHLLPVPMAPVADDHSFHDDRLVVLWLGGFDWPPNVEAARWLLEEVWPELRAGGTAVPVELHLVGRAPPPEITRHHDGTSIWVHGYQPDADRWRAEADVLVAPLLTGSGVRVKVVEALAAGLPVVSTSKGSEGLGLEAGTEVLVADDPAGFADALRRLAGSPDMRRRLSAAGKAFVAAHHAPARAAAVKAGVYDQILGGS